MKAYLAYTLISLKLAQRDRLTIFFNYIFPLVFFIIFAQAYHAGQGGAIVQVVTMVLIIGILGNGFFGAGLRAVQDRELNILRRFKVAPITPVPILVASMVTGFLIYMPTAMLVLVLAHFVYGMPWPAQPLSLAVLTSLGILSFRAVGLIIASVVNSAQESQILVQLLYLPMLFLSGATFPVSELPDWLQIVAQFLPATYLYTGMQGILFRNENLVTNWLPCLGLIVTGALATFIGARLFRWEKEERISTASKAWLLAVLAPFLLIGVYQAYSRDNVAKARVLYRELRRSRTLLIRDARLVVGDGTVIERGSLLVRGGKIERIYRGAAPDAGSLAAEAIEASGKTVLPGLIDVSVNLAAPGGLYDVPAAYDPARAIPRAIEAYLYSGVTTVRNTGDIARFARLLARFKSGERLGTEVLGGRPGAGELAASRERIPDAVFERMKADGLAYTPMLARSEAGEEAGRGSARLLDRSLVEQVGPAALLASTRRQIGTWKTDPAAVVALSIASDNLKRAWQAGVRLAAGSGSGSLLLLHGPALHRELELWVRAGIPAAVAIAGATANAARLLGQEQRIGVLAEGRDANLLVVDGNPLEDISATERISIVFLRGERVARSELFDQD